MQSQDGEVVGPVYFEGALHPLLFGLLQEALQVLLLPGRCSGSGGEFRWQQGRSRVNQDGPEPSSGFVLPPTPSPLVAQAFYPFRSLIVNSTQIPTSPGSWTGHGYQLSTADLS